MENRFILTVFLALLFSACSNNSTVDNDSVKYIPIFSCEKAEVSDSRHCVVVPEGKVLRKPENFYSQEKAYCTTWRVSYSNNSSKMMCHPTFEECRAVASTPSGGTKLFARGKVICRLTKPNQYIEGEIEWEGSPDGFVCRLEEEGYGKNRVEVSYCIGYPAEVIEPGSLTQSTAWAYSKEEDFKPYYATKSDCLKALKSSPWADDEPTPECVEYTIQYALSHSFGSN